MQISLNLVKKKKGGASCSSWSKTFANLKFMFVVEEQVIGELWNILKMVKKELENERESLRE